MCVLYVLLHEISSTCVHWPIHCAQHLREQFCVLVCSISQCVYVYAPSLFSIFYTSFSEL